MTIMCESVPIIIGCVLVTAWIIRRIARIPREVVEKLAFVMISAIFLGICCAICPELWYVFLASLCCILLSCFLAKGINIKKELEKYETRALENGFTVIYGEAGDFNIPHVQNSYNTIVRENRQPIGTLASVNKCDYSFIYTCSAPPQIYSMSLKQREFLKGTSLDYSLSSQSIDLQISRAGGNSILVHGGDFSCELPLRQRKFSLFQQNQLRAEFVIASSGFLLYCRESESHILTCIAYFLLLYQFGNFRMDED